MAEEKTVFEMVTEIAAAVNPLGILVTGFEGHRDLIEVGGKKPEITVRLSLPAIAVKA
jgi:hypothetical protein